MWRSSPCRRLAVGRLGVKGGGGAPNLDDNGYCSKCWPSLLGIAHPDIHLGPTQTNSAPAPAHLAVEVVPAEAPRRPHAARHAAEQLDHQGKVVLVPLGVRGVLRVWGGVG
jgi:hypothetical protein